MPVRTSRKRASARRARRGRNPPAWSASRCRRSPSNIADRKPGPFGQRRIVGKILAAFAGGAPMRVEQRGEGEGLRRLHRAQRGAVERRATRLSASISFTVSVTGRAGIAAPLLPRAAIARPTSAAEVNGRAASWTSTIAGRGARAAPPARRARNPGASAAPARAARSRAPGGGGKTRASSGWITGSTRSTAGCLVNSVEALAHHRAAANQLVLLGKVEPGAGRRGRLPPPPRLRGSPFMTPAHLTG